MCTNRQADAGRVGVIVPPRGLGSPSSGPLRGPRAYQRFPVDHSQLPPPPPGPPRGPLGPVRTYRPLVVPRQSEVGVRG